MPKPQQSQPDDMQDRDLTSRVLTVRAATANVDARTVDATISTEGAVEVYDWATDRIVEEVLLMSGAKMPETRQVPLLAVHSRWSLDDVIGSVREIRTEGGEMVGRLQFARDDDAERAWQKVRDGHITDVSVGYRVNAATNIEPNNSATINGRTFTAGSRALRVTTDWTPREVSLVPIGADRRARIRADESDNSDNQSRKETPAMAAEQKTEQAPEVKREETPAPVTPPVQPSIPAPADVARQAVEGERRRIHDIRDLAGQDVPAEMVQRAVDEGWDLNKASAEFLRALRESRKPSGEATPYHQSAHTGKLAGPVRAIACGLMQSRGLDPTKHVPHNGIRSGNPSEKFTAQDAEQGYEFRAMSSADVLRACIHADTGRWPMTIDHAFEMLRETATSGVSLSYAFTTNVYASLLAGWETVGDTTLGWCDEEDVPNFLTQENITFEANARPKLLPAGATAQHATASDSHETYKAARYALQFVMDEQTFINDRLNALAGMAAEMGEGTRAIRAEMVYAELLANPTMADTGALFNATAVTTAGGHANLTAGASGALAASALKVGIAAVMAQRVGRTATDPGRVINAPPRYLLAPSDLKWTADDLLQPGALVKLFADSADPVYSQRNPFAQMGIIPIIDDRLGTVGVMDPRTGSVRTGSATAWYLTTGGRRGMRVVYRRGTNRQPSMRSFVLQQGQWGMGYDISFDIGCKVIDFRSWYKANGA